MPFGDAAAPDPDQVEVRFLVQPDLVVIVLVGQAQQGVCGDPGAAADEYTHTVDREAATASLRVLHRAHFADAERAVVGIAHTSVDLDRDRGVVELGLSIARYPPKARLRYFH
jgi:hypothetical protein